MVTSRATRLLGPALTIGGLIWISDFAQIIVNGAITGHLPDAPDALLPLALRIGLRLFVASTIVLSIGLISLFLQLRSRSTKLAFASLPFMAIALVLATINTVLLSGLAGTPTFNDTFMGLSIFATAIATAFLSVAALRTQALPRWAALALLFVGITTIPVLFGTPLPIGPDWATDHLAFLTSGIAYTVVGARMWAARAADSAS
jgi:hypothetical protein